MKLNFLRFHVRRYTGLLELGEKKGGGGGGGSKTGRDLNNSVAGLLGLEQLSPTPRRTPAAAFSHSPVFFARRGVAAAEGWGLLG